MVRTESPSSINTYKQCPRKYYYHYVQGLPSKLSIHLIRGNIVHTVLEKFYDIENNILTEDDLRFHLFWLLDKSWNEKYSDLLELGLDDAKLKFYYEDSKRMLNNWFSRFKKKLRIKISDGMTFNQAFIHLTPIREEKFSSEKHNVQGFIDAIYKADDNVLIVDYKTSKKGELTPEYRLQLGIYAMMYEETHGVKPDIVGIDFMNHTELLIPATQKLIDEAVYEVDLIHTKTNSHKRGDYPMKPSPLCKWSTGQCDYYEFCFGRE